MKRLLLVLLWFPFAGLGQNYTSYFTGNQTNITTNPLGGVCLMGGASEDDNAMKWFLRRAEGGDVLVLRASGSNGYNSYMFNLGIPVNSVETIVFNNASASNEPYIHQKIQQAEAIWLAGGDQWDYIRYWRNTPVDSLINLAIQQRNVAVGGTSAGMAILGGYYFTARYGTVTSETALANPFNNKVNVDSARFITNDFLGSVITDTHFDNPDRRGRLVVFLARIYTDYGALGKGIACDEYTAVCIDTNGMAGVFGSYPSYDDNAYFIQTNCELADQSPENCTAGSPLTWYRGGEAIKVYRVKGTSTGSNTLNLNDWETGTGGTWLNWSANNGTFAEQPGDAIDCDPVSVHDHSIPGEITIFPNPSSDRVFICSENLDLRDARCAVFNLLGQEMPIEQAFLNNNKVEISVSGHQPGVYFLRFTVNGNTLVRHTLICVK